MPTDLEQLYANRHLQEQLSVDYRPLILGTV